MGAIVRKIGGAMKTFEVVVRSFRLRVKMCVHSRKASRKCFNLFAIASQRRESPLIIATWHYTFETATNGETAGGNVTLAPVLKVNP